ncbi:hypothetical protein OEA41_004418 [Lepraria neglecta]|uniref:STB6-like N-terminal domain-containing protein n=1 Tax=Lepraria neglecta TaxID=209136 RepID=A0AAD9Z094_9LECA|nr:hypothetical protein OEA41_004418 [Lepraria neglecta]
MDNETEEKDFAAGGESTYSPHGSLHAVTHNGNSTRPPAHQRLVFTDPAAFRYLEEDPCTTVLERRRILTGYELYIVEQWACSRAHPTFVITTYTGLEQNSVVVGILSVPTNEEAWSPRLRVYLQAITKYHARKKETPLGTLMVTNLSSFPSALTVIAVPDGDLKKHREDFIVNEDMKRLGCSGRAGLNLAPLTSATEAKFSQLYRTSDRIPLYNAVIELVKLCQVALMLFGKLAPEYADGLLCDVTEQAINDWWTEIGTEYFTIDPSDGILGPTTVAAILGMLMGARNRLNAYGAPVAKDVFDIVNTKRAIAHFQKSQKIDRTRRLNQQTLNRLHKATAKAASGEGWAVPRAVKSTVAELSGKGGDLVHGREKARIAEVETLNIDTFIQLGSGERFKWLWYGKPRKTTDSDVFRNLGGDDGMIFNHSDQGGQGWAAKKRDSVDDDTSLRHVLTDRVYLSPTTGSQTSIDHIEKDQALRRAVFKNVTGKVTDARSGLGRIRDAVGRRGHRGHHHRFSKDESVASDGESVKDRPRTSEELQKEPETAVLDATPPDSGEQSLVGSTVPSRRGSDFPEEASKPNDLLSPPFYSGANGEDLNKSASSLETPAFDRKDQWLTDRMKFLDDAAGITARVDGREAVDDSRKPSLTAEDTKAIQNMQDFRGQYAVPPLRTTRSFSKLVSKAPDTWDRRWPRHMSWTAMVDVLAAAVPSDITDSDNIVTRTNADCALAFENTLAMEGRVMGQRLEALKARETAWVEEKVRQIETYDEQASRDQTNADLVYHQKYDEYNALHNASDDLLTQERANLTEAIKDVETLGAKLEYELSALESKVEDVENGVAEFERQVIQIEMRAGELDSEKEATVTWTGWFLRKVGMV